MKVFRFKQVSLQIKASDILTNSLEQFLRLFTSVIGNVKTVVDIFLKNQSIPSQESNLFSNLNLNAIVIVLDAIVIVCNSMTTTA